MEGLVKGYDGNSQSGSFDEESLDGVDLIGRAPGVAGRDLKPEDAVREAVRAEIEVAGGHEQLTEFFLGRHARQQVVDAPVDRQPRIAIGEDA